MKCSVPVTVVPHPWKADIHQYQRHVISLIFRRAEEGSSNRQYPVTTFCSHLKNIAKIRLYPHDKLNVFFIPVIFFLIHLFTSSITLSVSNSLLLQPSRRSRSHRWLPITERYRWLTTQTEPRPRSSHASRSFSLKPLNWQNPFDSFATRPGAAAAVATHRWEYRTGQYTAYTLIAEIKPSHTENMYATATGLPRTPSPIPIAENVGRGRTCRNFKYQVRNVSTVNHRSRASVSGVMQIIIKRSECRANFFAFDRCATPHCAVCPHCLVIYHPLPVCLGSINAGVPTSSVPGSLSFRRAVTGEYSYAPGQLSTSMLRPRAFTELSW